MTGLLLGSGGWIPTPERATCSALLHEGDQALVIDAGTGISHLVAEPSLLEGVRTMDIVLTPLPPRPRRRPRLPLLAEARSVFEPSAVGTDLMRLDRMAPA